MFTETIHILGATDDRYSPWYGVMLTSLFENNKRERIIVHMLTGGLQAENESALHQLANRYGQALHFVYVDESALAKCPIRVNDHVTLSTWFRLLAPVLLPDSIDKVLYLDGDIIVNGPIKALWNTDIKDYAIGAAIDESYWNSEIYDRLIIDKQIPYTSAGVLLINLAYWRNKKGVERCFSCIEKMADKLLFHDQDTVNVVFQKEKRLLPITYNLQYGFIRKWSFSACDNTVQQEILSTIHNPVIIHYSGPGKPWFRFNDNPYRKFFLKYKRLSLWNNTKLQYVYSLSDILRDFAGRIARAIRLKEALYIINSQEL